MRCPHFECLRASSRYRYNYRCIPSKSPSPRLTAWLCSFRQLHTSPGSCVPGNDDDKNDTININTDLRLLNKSLYDASVKCHRLGWYARRNRLPSDRNELPKNSMKEFLVHQGIGFERYVYANKYGYHDPSSNGNNNQSDGDFPPQPRCRHHNNNQHHDIRRPQPKNLAIVHERSPATAAQITNSLMARDFQCDGGDPVDTILQPTFLCGNRVARADVVVRSNATVTVTAAVAASGDGSPPPSLPQPPSPSWEILEIKSSTEKSFRRKIPDLAFTVSVARSAGYHVSKASLIVVDPSYVRKDIDTDITATYDSDGDGSGDPTSLDDPDGNLLYKTIDCTELVDSYILENKIDERITTIDQITGGDDNNDDDNNDRNDNGNDNGNYDDRSVPPPVKYKAACGKCELLGVECGPRSNSSCDDPQRGDEGTVNANTAAKVLPLKHGIWELPRLSPKQFPDVLERALPTLEIKDMDESSLLLLTKNQIKFFRAVTTDAVVVEHTKLEKCLREIARGGSVVMYLDFEAVSILNPPHSGMVPYETMITQYSLHKHEAYADESVDGHTHRAEFEEDGGRGLSHSEYLADPQRDCRRELLEHLLDDLGYGSNAGDSDSGDRDCDSIGVRVRGPIMVYSSYEKTQLNKLAGLFPEHADAISDVIEHRLVDLEKIIKDCVSHPGFCGRSSIKMTLPALVPGFERAYEDLHLLTDSDNDGDGERGSGNGQSGIADGGAAVAAFAELISGRRSEVAEVDRTRTALLEYCKLDTMALVEIHKALWKLIHDRSVSRETEALESEQNMA